MPPASPMSQCRTLLVAAALAVSSQAAAQTTAKDTLLLGQGAAPFWAISVADIERQKSFYRDTLGFAVFSEGTAPNAPIKFALLKQGMALVELVQIPDSKSLKDIDASLANPSRARGFFKGGVVVPDVETLYRTLRARGVRFAFELTQPPGGPYRVFGINDPEGNLLQFFGT